MRGSSGPESSSPTLVEIRASIRCSSGFLIAARICSLWEKNQNTSITATTAPRNIVMVINQIICALALRPTTVPSLLQEGPSFTELNCTSGIGHWPELPQLGRRSVDRCDVFPVALGVEAIDLNRRCSVMSMLCAAIRTAHWIDGRSYRPGPSKQHFRSARAIHHSLLWS